MRFRAGLAIYTPLAGAFRGAVAPVFNLNFRPPRSNTQTAGIAPGRFTGERSLPRLPAGVLVGLRGHPRPTEGIEMSIQFRCTHCEKLLSTQAGTEGQKAKCPQCGTVLVIPDASSAAAPEGANPLETVIIYLTHRVSSVEF